VRFSKEIKVGLFAIITISMFYLGFNFLKGIEFFSRSNRYYVIYKDVGGLTKSNPVTISGFNVGRVADISLLQNDGNIVLVALDIERDIILGDSAVAKLDANFLGEVSIVVEVGDILRPIEPYDTLFSRVDPGLTEMLVSSAQPITDNLPVTIANLNALLEDLQGSGEGLKKALDSFTKTSNTLNYTLNENREGIKTALVEYRDLAKKLNSSMDGLKPLISKFNVLADSLNNLELANTVKKLNTMLEETSATVTAFRNKESTLGKLMYEDSLYNNLNSTMLALDSLLIHMNENPKHFFGPLGKSRKKIEKDLAKQQKE
jgi:phospholipid/cholesterol/gamma-HCH transport system substrate-binding protein